MGLLPLIKGLPVRLTDHTDRNLGLYKQTKCTIHGWTLNINEARSCLVARTHLIHRMCTRMCTRRTRALLSYAQHSRAAHHACDNQHTSTRHLRRTE